MSQIETSPGELLMSAYAAAVLAKQPERLAELYAPDVRVFDAWGVWSFEDRDAWLANLQAWLGSLGPESVQVRFDDVRGGHQGETAWLSAIVTFSALAPDGRQLHAMQNRLSWSLVNTTAGWRIAHEHTSAPISFETQKAILTRA